MKNIFINSVVGLALLFSISANAKEEFFEDHIIAISGPAVSDKSWMADNQNVQLLLDGMMELPSIMRVEVYDYEDLWFSIDRNINQNSIDLYKEDGKKLEVREYSICANEGHEFKLKVYFDIEKSKKLPVAETLVNIIGLPLVEAMYTFDDEAVELMTKSMLKQPAVQAVRIWRQQFNKNKEDKIEAEKKVVRASARRDIDGSISTWVYKEYNDESELPEHLQEFRVDETYERVKEFGNKVIYTFEFENANQENEGDLSV